LVLERAANGAWSWTATLPPPAVGELHLDQVTSRVAASGDLIACQRFRPQDVGQLQTALYRRNAPGVWTWVQTIVSTALGDICLGNTGLARIGAPQPVDALGRAGFDVGQGLLGPFVGSTLYAQALTTGPGSTLSRSVEVQQ
jgi:hypothetical protein